MSYAYTPESLAAGYLANSPRSLGHSSTDKPYVCSFPDGVPPEIDWQGFRFSPWCDKCRMGAIAYVANNPSASLAGVDVLTASWAILDAGLSMEKTA